MSVGFIRDKLEIKFLILYVAARVTAPLPRSDMQALTMIDEGIDYFAFAECLNDLVETEHLCLNQREEYAITPKGMKNSEICQSSLPYSVRMRADRDIDAYNKELVRRQQVRGDVKRRDNGTYTVELSLSDDVDNVMKLQLMVATQDMADALVARFRENPEQVYGDLLRSLYGGK